MAERNQQETFNSLFVLQNPCQVFPGETVVEGLVKTQDGTLYGPPAICTLAKK